MRRCRGVRVALAQIDYIMTVCNLTVNVLHERCKNCVGSCDSISADGMGKAEREEV